MPKLKLKETGPLERLFGSNVTARVLGFLILHRDWDYTLTDISREAKVGWGSANRIWKILEKYQLVKETRRVGRARLYKINLENPIIEGLIKAYFSIADIDAKKALEKEEIKLVTATK